MLETELCNHDSKSGPDMPPICHRYVYLCKVEDWFSVALGYPYHPRLHGTLCEWLLQLVTIAFRADLSEPRTMTSVQHIQAAADAWTVFIMVRKGQSK